MPFAQQLRRTALDGVHVHHADRIRSWMDVQQRSFDGSVIASDMDAELRGGHARQCQQQHGWH
jgi:hypothetical protein